MCLNSNLRNCIVFSLLISMEEHSSLINLKTLLVLYFVFELNFCCRISIDTPNWKPFEKPWLEYFLNKVVTFYFTTPTTMKITNWKNHRQDSFTTPLGGLVNKQKTDALFSTTETIVGHSGVRSKFIRKCEEKKCLHEKTRIFSSVQGLVCRMQQKEILSFDEIGNLLNTLWS